MLPSVSLRLLFFSSMSEPKSWLTQLTRKRPGVTLVCSGSNSFAEIVQAISESSATLQVSCDGVDFFTACLLSQVQTRLSLKTSSKLDLRLKNPSKASTVNLFGLSTGSVTIIPMRPVARSVSFDEIVYCSLSDGLKYERLQPGRPGRHSGVECPGRFEINGEQKVVWLGRSQVCKGLDMALRKMAIGEVRLATVPAVLDCKNGSGVYKIKFLGY